MIIANQCRWAFYMARAVVPQMLQRGAGSIINISMSYETMKSSWLFSLWPLQSCFLSPKTAIWAQDLAETGIRVNILLPGGGNQHRHDFPPTPHRRCAPSASAGDYGSACQFFWPRMPHAR